MGGICPWWLGYLLASPIRKWILDPERILSPYLAKGMTAVDIGCGMGYFSIPMANLVGSGGKVICVDLQEKMLASLKRRAKKAGVLDRIEIRLAAANSLRLEDRARAADFAQAFAVVHEVPDHVRLFDEISAVLKTGAKLLIAEPRGHVSEQAFAATMSIAQERGLEIAAIPEIWHSRSALLIKK
jgi:ubiquinone/menaquinone biosynthesis C-methylase UbiE